MAFSQPSERSFRRAGFTLVEVTLALGIVAFASSLGLRWREGRLVPSTGKL